MQDWNTSVSVGSSDQAVSVIEAPASSISSPAPDIDQIMTAADDGSDEAAPVTEAPTPDVWPDIPHIDQLVTAIISTLHNPMESTFSSQSEFWTSVLSHLNPEHEVFQSLNPFREIPKFYNKFKARAIRKYGEVADLKGMFGKGTKEAGAKPEQVGSGGKTGKQQPRRRSMILKTLRKQKKKLFHLQGLGETLPEIESEVEDEDLAMEE